MSPPANLPRILVVDDSAMIRKACQKVLAAEYAITEATNGVEALEILKKDRHFRLIITDLSMPGLDGFGLIKALRGSKSDDLKSMPVIVVTGQEESNDLKLKALEKGATDLITKPFTSADLLACCRTHTTHQKVVKTLKKQVARDPVTGLIGRKMFDIQLDKDVSRVVRHQEPLAVMLVEIQAAKVLFDELGDARSQSLLKMVSGLLTKAIRKEDTLARLTDGIFALSLPTAKPESAVEMGRRILLALQGVKLKNKGKPVEFAIALGVCTMEIGHCPPSDTIKREMKNAIVKARAEKQGNLYVLRFPQGKPEKEKPQPTVATKKTVPAKEAAKPIVTLPPGARGIDAKTVPHLPNGKTAPPKAAPPTEPTFSVDAVLGRLAKGESNKKELAEALRQVKPLLKLLSKEQRDAFLK